MIVPDATPAVTLTAELVKTSLLAAAGLTENPLLVPVSVPPVLVTVIVLSLPDCVTVTLSVRTPLLNAPEVVGLIVPAVVAKSTVPVNAVTVLLLASCAVIVMLNVVPAVCVEIVPMAK